MVGRIAADPELFSGPTGSRLSFPVATHREFTSDGAKRDSSGVSCQRRVSKFLCFIALAVAIRYRLWAPKKLRVARCWLGAPLSSQLGTRSHDHRGLRLRGGGRPRTQMRRSTSARVAPDARIAVADSYTAGLLPIDARARRGGRLRPLRRRMPPRGQGSPTIAAFYLSLTGRYSWNCISHVARLLESRFS